MLGRGVLSTLAAGWGRWLFCVRMLFGRLTQIETLGSDLSKASFGSTLLALSCPDVLALTCGGRGDVTDSLGSGSGNLLPLREQKFWSQEATRVNKAVACRFPLRRAWNMVAGWLCSRDRRFPPAPRE